MLEDYEKVLLLLFLLLFSMIGLAFYFSAEMHMESKKLYMECLNTHSAADCQAVKP